MHHDTMNRGRHGRTSVEAAPGSDPLVPFDVTPGASAGRDRRPDDARQRSRPATWASRRNIWEAALQGQGDDLLRPLRARWCPPACGPIIVHMIENRMIDVLVCTGANLYHDVYESLGFAHGQTDPDGDDMRLGDLRVVRFFDVLAPEHEFSRGERFCTEFSLTLEDDRPYTTREYFSLLGKAMAPIAQEEGILTAAAKARRADLLPGVRRQRARPRRGRGAAAHGKRIQFDVVGDVLEMVHMSITANKSAVIYVGGGTPKNYIQQCGVAVLPLRPPAAGPQLRHPDHDGPAAVGRPLRLHVRRGDVLAQDRPGRALRHRLLRGHDRAAADGQRADREEGRTRAAACRSWTGTTAKDDGPHPGELTAVTHDRSHELRVEPNLLRACEIWATAAEGGWVSRSRWPARGRLRGRSARLQPGVHHLGGCLMLEALRDRHLALRTWPLPPAFPRRPARIGSPGHRSAGPGTPGRHPDDDHGLRWRIRQCGVTDLRIERVTDEAHARLTTSALSLKASGTGCRTPSAASSHARLLDEPDWAGWVGYADGVPVATAQLVVHENVAGLYYIATVEAARRKGYADALTRIAMREGLARGCDLVCLQASPYGRPVYERIGFDVIGEYVTYVPSDNV